MSLIACSGFEIQDAGTSNPAGSDSADGTWSSTNAAYVTANRPGSAGTHAVSCDNKNLLNGPSFSPSVNYATATAIHYIRYWAKWSGLPFSSAWLYPVALFSLWEGCRSVSVRSDGSIILNNCNSSPQVVLAASGAGVISAATWHKIDLIIRTDASVIANNTVTLNVDDVQAFTFTAASAGSNPVTHIDLGAGMISATTGANNAANSDTTQIDDFSWRDNQGTSCNTAPDDSEQLTVLKPTADSSIGNWTAGGGATTSLFDATNNEPPVGVATATNTSSIKNVNKTVPSSYTATCNVDAAVTAGSDALGIYAAAQTGSPQTKNALTGHIVVNGTASTATVTPTNLGVAQGTYPTGWLATSFAVTLSGTVAASYTLGFAKETASTSEIDVCSLQGYLLTLPPAPSVLAAVPVRVVAQAVNRAGTY